jgi:hypothetical protein
MNDRRMELGDSGHGREKGPRSGTSEGADLKNALAAPLVSRSSASSGASGPGLETSVFSPGDAAAKKYCQGGHGTKTRGSAVLDVAERLGIFAVGGVWFERGTARNRTWRELEPCVLDWASRSLQREFEVVIMVEGLIGEMFGSD